VNERIREVDSYKLNHTETPVDDPAPVMRAFMTHPLFVNERWFPLGAGYVAVAGRVFTKEHLDVAAGFFTDNIHITFRANPNPDARTSSSEC
jgi:hypothetical protein